MKVKKTKKTPGPSVLKKAVSNVTKIVKKNDKVTKKTTTEKATQKNLKVVKKTVPKKSKKGKDNAAKKSPEEKEEKRHVSTKGVIYIGHIPYGFFESEMQEYFEQFGKVTRVRVARSKTTGKSRGYGYIEFEEPDVAKVAAETMNNYLMCGRLLKTTYIPPEKQHRGYFLGTPWTTKIYPKVANRMKELRKNDSPITEKKHKTSAKKSLKKLAALEETLNNVGIKIKFTPKNVPKLK